MCAYKGSGMSSSTPLPYDPLHSTQWWKGAAFPNNANFSFSYIEGESLVLRLNAKGVAGSTGSACSSKKLEPSHVLLAIGLDPVDAHGSLRLTLGRDTTEANVQYVNEYSQKSLISCDRCRPSVRAEEGYGKPE